jgi:hypothetical protein
MRNAECGMRKEKKEDRGQNSEVGMRNAEVEKWRVTNVNTNEKIADSGLKKLSLQDLNKKPTVLSRFYAL